MPDKAQHPSPDAGPQSIRGDRGASITGPRNLALERENPDMLASPPTDADTIPNLKFSFAAVRNRLVELQLKPGDMNLYPEQSLDEWHKSRGLWVK